MRDVIFVMLDWISQALANRFIQYKLLIYKDKVFSQVVGLDGLLRLRRVLANPGLLLERLPTTGRDPVAGLILSLTPKINQPDSILSRLASLESAEKYFPISEVEKESPTFLNSTTSFSQPAISWASSGFSSSGFMA